MRTTLEIDDTVLASARAIARDESISLGAAVSLLARRGMSSVGAIDTTTGFPTFAIDTTARPVTIDDVNANRD